MLEITPWRLTPGENPQTVTPGDEPPVNVHTPEKPTQYLQNDWLERLLRTRKNLSDYSIVSLYFAAKNYASLIQSLITRSQLTNYCVMPTVACDQSDILKSSSHYIDS